MSRILTLLSIVLLLASGWFVYSQGIIGQMFNPTAIVLKVDRNIAPNQRIRFNDIIIAEESLSAIPSGAITFKSNISQDEVTEFLKDGRSRDRVRKGDVLTAGNYGRASELYQIRVMAEFDAGDPIDQGMLDVFPTETPETGTLTFQSREEANLFVDSRDALRASREMEAGKTLSIDDISSSEGGAVYVLETMRTLSEGAIITSADVRASTLPSTEIPRGAISFPSRSGADIFVTASQSLSLAFDVAPGTILTAEMLRPGSTRVLRDMSQEEDPETFAELVALQSLAPFDVKFINLLVDFPDLEVDASVTMIGGKPIEGDTLDMWVETQATQGPFGTITLRRFVQDIEIKRVVDPELVLAERERQEEMAEEEVSGATPEAEDDTTDAAKGIYYWANVTRKGGLAIEEAKEDERMVFMLSSNTPISDFLGNGVTCREDMCTVSREVSDDMTAVRNALAIAQGQEVEQVAEEERLAPFAVLDGVSLELEEAMHEEGFRTFEDVARWEDGQIELIVFQLGITRNLAIYVRQQARTIVNMPSMARQELGITGTPGVDTN